MQKINKLSLSVVNPGRRSNEHAAIYLEIANPLSVSDLVGHQNFSEFEILLPTQASAGTHTSPQAQYTNNSTSCLQHPSPTRPQHSSCQTHLLNTSFNLPLPKPPSHNKPPQLPPKLPRLLTPRPRSHSPNPQYLKDPAPSLLLLLITPKSHLF